ncbi:MAG: DUF1800 domain-containing protein [bacterium]|nr:DUF1800 domain-containing protein [bacterium]
MTELKRPVPQSRLGQAARLSRRRMLGGDELRRQETFSVPPPPPVTTSPAGVADEIVMLVHRTTQGYTEEAYAQATGLGYDGWIEHQLDYENLDVSVLENLFSLLYPSLAMTGPELYATYGVPGEFGIPVDHLRIAAVLRSILSPRQLYERMVEFWTDHFNIYQLRSDSVQLLKTVDDRDVIRAHALGSFRDMVHASARSGAMITYLDNLTNIVGSPNENYARELMELHTLGVDGPYDENDVRELARCFTGWTLTSDASNWGEFIFHPPFHDFGAKQVLGLTIPAGGGESDALTVIDHILSSPSTATFLSRKMSSWILGYDPPQPLVDQVAQTYLMTNGDIKSMLRVILRRNHVMADVPFDQRKYKRPSAFVNGLLRQTRPEGIGVLELLTQTLVMGHLPFNWVSPDGYPDTVEAWAAAILPRWNLASQYLNGDLATAASDTRLTMLMQGAPLASWARRIDQFMTGGLLTPHDLADVQGYLNGKPATFELLREAIALVASSPSYQYY